MSDLGLLMVLGGPLVLALFQYVLSTATTAVAAAPRGDAADSPATATGESATSTDSARRSRSFPKVALAGPLLASGGCLLLLWSAPIQTFSLGTWFSVGSAEVSFAFRPDRLAQWTALAAAFSAFLLKMTLVVSFREREALRPEDSGRLDLELAMAAWLFFAGDLVLALAAFAVAGFLRSRAGGSTQHPGGGAFSIQRFGDLLLVFGAALLLRVSGSSVFEIWAERLPTLSAELGSGIGIFGISKGTAIALLLVLGVGVKTAQIPFPQWPKSFPSRNPSLDGFAQTFGLHAAGIFLLVRLQPLLDISPTTRIVITAMGAVTAVASATSALVAWRIDRVLSLSSLSQLGVALVAVGLGQTAVAVSLVFLHGLAKTALWIASEAAQASLAGERDLRRMGGLRKRMPTTHLAAFLAVASLAGLPPFAGFFGLGDALAVAGTSRLGHGWFLWLVLSLAAFIGTIVHARFLILVFHGRCRASEARREALQRAPWPLRLPLLALSGAMVFLAGYELQGAFAGERPWRALFERGLGAAELASRGGFAVELAFLFLSVMVGVAGLFVALRFYVTDPEWAARLAKQHGDLVRFWRDGYRVDRVYDRYLGAPLKSLVDRGVARSIENAVAEEPLRQITRAVQWTARHVAALRIESAPVIFAIAAGTLLIVLLSLLT